jgi:CRISPR/Cas system CSM-associated protein Csm3 (group 7 of RAMP superfamily)
MITLRFRVEFAGPFRVSAGHARPGVDAAIDLTDALPASSLKGVMRATAKQLLGDDHQHVAAVFGTPANPTPWEWEDAIPVDGAWRDPVRASRIHIGADHVAQNDMLGTAEQTQAAAATFAVHQRSRLADEQLRLHRIVLAVSAAATRTLGANRRRGLGWVHIRCDDVALDAEAISRFLSQEAT